MCGHMLGVVCQVCIALYTFGTTIAFLVIIGDQLVDGKPYKMHILAKSTNFKSLDNSMWLCFIFLTRTIYV